MRIRCEIKSGSILDSLPDLRDYDLETNEQVIARLKSQGQRQEYDWFQAVLDHENHPEKILIKIGCRDVIRRDNFIYATVDQITAEDSLKIRNPTYKDGDPEDTWGIRVGDFFIQTTVQDSFPEEGPVQ